MNWPELPLYLRRDDVPALPSGWTVASTDEASIKLKAGKRYDQKTVEETGAVPVINQSEDGLLGYHDDEPGVIASHDEPVVTFANHTCEMRLMTQPFSSIQNVFPKTGKPGVCETVYFYYATKGRVRLHDYKGHHPIFRKAFFPLPPVETQRRIAGILSAYDELIENNTRRIRLLEEMARALYREWFVHYRFPGHEAMAMVEHAELGAVPERWEVRPLKKVSRVNRESIKGTNAPDEIDYVNITSVSTGSIDQIEPMRFADAPSRARRRAKHGDIIWSTVRPNRRSYAVIMHPPDSLVVSTGFAVITPGSLPYTYLYHAVTTDQFVGYLTNRATGAAYPAVTSTIVKDAPILTPPSCLAQSFHTVAEPIFELKHNLLLKNHNLRQTRDLLLPRLVSGALPVEAAEEELEAVA